MAKTIKRVGIIFFVLVVSLLVAVGSVFAVNVTSNDFNANAKDISSENNEEINSEYVAEKAQVPVSDSEFLLTGTLKQMEEIWNNAINESINNGRKVKVVLGGNWIAENDQNYTKSFGIGAGFLAGKIFVPKSANMILDLNGQTINRNLAEMVDSGECISVYGSLSIIDSSYNSEMVRQIYFDNQLQHYEEESVNAIKAKFLAVNCGKITGGKNTGSGGAIWTASDSNLEVYGGMFYGNYANKGAAIYVSEKSKFTLYDGLFVDNEFKADGTIYVSSSFNAYGSVFYGNYSNGYAACGGGIVVAGFHIIANINDCIIAGNRLSDHGLGGGLFNTKNAETQLNNCIIANNYTEYVGGAIYNYHYSTLNVIDCQLLGNETDYGGAIHTNGDLTITRGLITNNIAYHAPGIFSNVEPIDFKLSGAVQIYGNKKNSSTESDSIVLGNKRQLQISGKLEDNTGVARIEITVTDTRDKSFPLTLDYSRYHANIDPNRYFVNKDYKLGFKYDNGEVVLDTETPGPTEQCSWTVTPQGGTPIQVTDSRLTVTYTGKPFVVTNSKNNFCLGSTTTAISSYNDAINVGSYGFYSNEYLLNRSFILTIVPKEVDIVWNNTKFEYTGTSLCPSATVKSGDLIGSDTCDVTVTGGQILAGSYIATATELSNENYKLKPGNIRYTDFIIEKTDLIIDIATNNCEREFTGNKVDIDNNWYAMSTSGLVGRDKGHSLSSLFGIDKDSFIHVLKQNTQIIDSAVNVGEYDITVKEFDASKVFTGNANYNVKINYVNGGKLTITPSNVVRASVESGYDYLVLDNDRRVAYKDRGMIHGENDSNVNVANGNAQYVIGNIMPETSVQTLLNGLVYNQKTESVVVYDKQGGIVADNNAVVGTGWYIEYAGEKIYLSVLGDVTGDGRIDATDITYLRRIANGEVNNLSIAVQLAAYVDNRGKITSVDAEILRAVCKYETTIKKYF